MFKTNKETKSTQGVVESMTDAITSQNGAAQGTAYNANSLYNQPTETSTTSRAMSESDALARDIKEGTLSGFVGNGTVLTGEATFKGMLRVDGHMTGHITSADGTLLVGNNGVVDANVAVAVATIHGTVNGDIVATKRIEIGRTARVVGNIYTPSLMIEQGGVLEGNCRMIQPREDAAAAEMRHNSARDINPVAMQEAGDAYGEVSDVAS